MRFLCWSALLGLLTAATAAEPPPTVYGPRITLQSETEPLGEVVRALARQLNRQFTGPVLDNETLANRPTALRLDGATVYEALRALQEVTGYRVNRQSRWSYQLTTSRTFLPDRRPFGDYHVALYYVRYNYDSYLYLGDPARNSLTARLMPYFYLYAPSDAEALRIQSIGPPTASVGGQALAAVSTNRPALTPDNRDPSVWTCYSYVDAPPPETAVLDEVSLPVTYYQSLRELVFEFREPWQTKSRSRRHGGYTATIASKSTDESDQTLRVTIAGPVPDGFDEQRINALLRSELWCEARFYQGDEPLFTETSGAGANQKDGVWTSRWTLKLGGVDAGRPVDRLVVRFYVPGKVGESLLTSYSQVPLPDRQDKQDEG